MNADHPLHFHDARDAAAEREAELRDDWRELCGVDVPMTPAEERAFWIKVGCDVAARRDAKRAVESELSTAFADTFLASLEPGLDAETSALLSKRLDELSAMDATVRGLLP